MRTRRIFLWTVMAVVGCIPFLAAAAQGRLPQQDKRLQAAQIAAAQWLAMVDAGEYGKSWQMASPLLKQVASQSGWEEKMRAARLPLGRLRSRRVESASFHATLPGAPDGSYVVIQYASSFEHKQSATETVTMRQEQDRVWRAAGYFIR